MARFRLLVAYHGASYYGWQKQNANMPTIQSVIEQALYQVFQQKLSVVGAGRTDTGAHAIGQNIHFDLKKPLPAGLSIAKALNHYLPADIRVQKVWKAPATFHALRSCIAKSYIYCVFNQPLPSVFLRGQVHWYPYKIDLHCLREMNHVIQGRHDFKSFQNSGTLVKSTIRTIHQARWIQRSKNIFIFYVQGDGFLKQMIRNLVGTQLALLAKKTDPIQSGKTVSAKKSVQILKNWRAILLAKDRKAALKTAPADGLYLYKVYYPTKLDRKCREI